MTTKQVTIIFDVSARSKDRFSRVLQHMMATDLVDARKVEVLSNGLLCGKVQVSGEERILKILNKL